MALLAALIAAFLFVLAAFGIRWDAVDITNLGLAFLALAIVLGALAVPLPRFNLSRKE